MTMLRRRRFLALGGGAGAVLLVSPRIAFATVESRGRFLFIIQRGAADGLSTIIPYGDPDYARLRGGLAAEADQATKLDGHFALHGSLKQTAAMYRAGEALFVHAVASPYRDRSHFDGQNVLETGGNLPYQVKDGWLNRLAALLPRTRDTAIAFAPTVPAALRGPIEVASYAPSALPAASDDLLARVGELYAADAQLHPLWDEAMASRGVAGDLAARQDPASLGALAATFLKRDDGPRIGMIETGGWDTHSQQQGRIARQLDGLDSLLGALKAGLGPVWSDTVVLIATEFGRTAAVNGTGGTDHGTASAAMLIGGAVKGGRIVADWPGLAPAALYQQRDLRPTIALDALIAGTAAEALSLAPPRVQTALFAGAPGRPIEGIVRV
jgi:uncharacterized protein (DUF1501 family)